MAANVFTNVEGVTHNLVALSNVTSVSFTENQDFLFSQSDGNRAQCVAGMLGNVIEVTVEMEDDGTDRGSRIGIAAAGDLVFNIQDGDTPATLKTWTLTDIVFNSLEYGTDQAGPNTVTLSGRATDEDDTASVA